ncbi:MAG: hypothetical protein ACOYIF_00880 [Acetivibrionales bacterium]|jgi:hypothetical protein
MKVKLADKASILILFFLLPVMLTMSCGPKVVSFEEITENNEPEICISSNTEFMTSRKDDSSQTMSEEYSPPIKNELEGLKYVLSPYLSPSNDLFIGDEDKNFIENSFLNPENINLYISASDLEKVVKITLSFDDDHKWRIKEFITNFSYEDKIERQYAVSGLMNLLALRYPLSLEMETEDIQKSNVMADLSNVDEKHRSLVCKAYRLGFTDFTVDKCRMFRPADYLNHGEAISMLYRIFINLGIPGAEKPAFIDNEEPPIPTEDNYITDQQQEAYSVENIYSEYRDYKNSLEKTKSAANSKRIKMLNQAEEILAMAYESQTDKNILDINTWINILNKVFGLDTEEINAHISFSTDSTLTYDIVAVSIFEFPYLMGGKKTRDANEQELAAARVAIQQFDTAADISKFAQFYFSGLLKGIYELPGFTPKRPVNDAEAMLIIMRIVKGLSI